MKYISFTSSCSYCCIANILELLGIEDVSDKEIALAIGLPFIFHYDEKECSFTAGAMNQGKVYFDLYLNKIGYTYVEDNIDKNQLVEYLKKHRYPMLGIKIEHKKHAILFIKKINQKYYFLNPHHINSNQEDYFIFSKEDLEERLDETFYVGYVAPLEGKTIPPSKAIYLNSLEALERFEKEIIEYCSREQSKESFYEIRDCLFRAFVIDLPAMMEISSCNTILEKLKILQTQVFSLFQKQNFIPFDSISKELLLTTINEYKALIEEYLTKFKEVIE